MWNKMVNRKQIKRESKELLRRSHASPYLLTFLYMAAGIVLNVVSAVVSGSYIEDVNRFTELINLTLPFQLTPLVDLPNIVITFITLTTTLFFTVLSQGYTLYHMGIRRGEEKGCDTLLDGFTFVGKIVLLFVLLRLIVMGGFLLLVVPAIIFAYRYSFAFYNLCENPEIGVTEALNMSARQTKGYKWQLFVLDLSFMGWYLLAALTLGILDIWIQPWVTQSHLAYFDAAKASSGVGKTVPRNSIDNTEFQ